MSPNKEDPSWLSYLTIDLIVYCAKVTIFQPFFAWMLPLSLRAVTVPYSDISFKLTTLYAAAITVFWVLRAINRRIAFGSSREVDITEEVVVITGGASGLGLSIADFYRMKGAAVAVLDIKDNEDQEEDGVYHYHCDVGNAAEVRSVGKKIIEEVLYSIIFVITF
jgi:NADPH:quinone reductase-like Zn-dependent oxidoreductase